MPLPVPEPGLVIAYSYLWRHEYNRGRQEGVKTRPCAIVLAAQTDKVCTMVTVAPITHQPPADPARAIPIPAVVKRQLGLDDAASWIVADEVNRFVWPGPDLQPVSRREPDRFAYGHLPEDVFDALRQRIIDLYRLGAVRLTPRSE